jgi:hypothetical protein
MLGTDDRIRWLMVDVRLCISVTLEASSASLALAVLNSISFMMDNSQLHGCCLRMMAFKVSTF